MRVRKEGEQVTRTRIRGLAAAPCPAEAKPDFHLVVEQWREEFAAEVLAHEIDLEHVEDLLNRLGRRSEAARLCGGCDAHRDGERLVHEPHCICFVPRSAEAKLATMADCDCDGFPPAHYTGCALIEKARRARERGPHKDSELSPNAPGSPGEPGGSAAPDRKLDDGSGIPGIPNQAQPSPRAEAHESPGANSSSGPNAGKTWNRAHERTHADPERKGHAMTAEQVYDALIAMGVREPAVVQLGERCVAGRWEEISERLEGDYICRAGKVAIIVLGQAATWSEAHAQAVARLA